MMHVFADRQAMETAASGGSVKAEGLGDGCTAFVEGHRQAVLDGATRHVKGDEAGCREWIGHVVIS
jgi:hypothetical protein